MLLALVSSIIRYSSDRRPRRRESDQVRLLVRSHVVSANGTWIVAALVRVLPWCCVRAILGMLTLAPRSGAGRICAHYPRADEVKHRGWSRSSSGGTGSWSKSANPAKIVRGARVMVVRRRRSSTPRLSRSISARLELATPRTTSVTPQVAVRQPATACGCLTSLAIIMLPTARVAGCMCANWSSIAAPGSPDR